MLDRLRALHRTLLSVAERLGWLPPLAARVSVGLVFVTTGWGKLQNLDRVVDFFRSLGIPAPELQAPFVAATELSCGLLLVLGLATRFAAVPLVITMLVAIRTALWSELEGVIDLFGREEYLFGILLGWLAVAGAGAVSLDALVARRIHLGRFARRASATALAVLAFAAAPAPASAREAEPFSEARFRTLQAEDALILVDVAASWCSTCARQERILGRYLDANPGVQLAWLRVDYDAQRESVAFFRAPRQSTLILYRGEERLWFSVAETDPDAIAAAIEAAARRP